MAAEGTIGDRRTREAELLSLKGFMKLAELAGEIGVSESTVRRDLEVLEEQGLLKRTYGGAVFIQDTSPQKLAFADREMTAAAEKRAIAAAVAEIIPENQTLILNGGTTCSEVARALVGRHLSVLTNSVPIASLLSSSLEPEVTLLGGYVYPRTGVALGATTIGQLGRLRVPRLVLSCAGLTRQGLFNVNQMMADVERRMIDVADEVILAVDHAKFGIEALARICDVEQIDVIVTDQGADRQTRDWLESLDMRIVFAEPPAPPSEKWRSGGLRRTPAGR
jgi:DeoR family fructose operon transcriptional repressor